MQRIRAIWDPSRRCTAMSKQAARRCEQAAVSGRSTYHWHGGHNPGAPKGKLNAANLGGRMREDVTIRKTGVTIGGALRGMIKGTMLAYEKQLPREMGRAHFHGFVQVIDEASRTQEEARQQKQERVERHFERETSQPKPETRSARSQEG